MSGMIDVREQVRSAENTRRHQLQPFPPSFIAFYSRSTPGLCSWDPSPGSLCQLAPLACGLEWLRLEYYEQSSVHGKLGARPDQVAHCPRLATGGQATATRPRVSGCATRRRLAWPGPACFLAKTRSSSQPARP